MIKVRDYHPFDFTAVLRLIEVNSPKYFHPSEKEDFINYLNYRREDYFIIEKNKVIVASGGINTINNKIRISWDLVDPNEQKKGLGSLLLNHRTNFIKENYSSKNIEVRTSQYAFEFYQKQGFKLVNKEKDFWAKGIHLFQMELKL